VLKAANQTLLCICECPILSEVLHLGCHLADAVANFRFVTESADHVTT